MSSKIWDGPCPTCGRYSLDCTCGLFDSKENESMESHQERKELYELNSIRDESLHIQPYADMIDKLTYVQKADFAKRALELERDYIWYKKMFEEVSRERNAWISEYRAARAEVERLKAKNDWISVEDRLPELPMFVAVHKGTQPRIIGCYFDSDSRFRYGDQDHTDSVTHWRHITQPPTNPF